MFFCAWKISAGKERQKDILTIGLAVGHAGKSLRKPEWDSTPNLGLEAN